MSDEWVVDRLPTVLPGQICVIEHDPAAALSASDRDALAAANVVLYDRALGPLVADILPLGGYAEPLPNAAGPALSPRGLELATQGWSVVQLVAANVSRCMQLHAVAPRADGTAATASAPAYAFTGNGLAG